MQPNEQYGQAFVFILDETYGGDEETWERDSEEFRLNLEREYGSRFEEANVGPGADIPAFLTDVLSNPVTIWAGAVGVFFLGKPIQENLKAWTEMAATVRKFFSRPIVLGRHAAAIVAVEAVFCEMGGTPGTIKLTSYRTGHIADDELLPAMPVSDEIADSPDTLFLGHIRHIFEIEADGSAFRVAIDGSKAEVVKLS